MARPDNEFKDLTVVELKALAEQLVIDIDGITKKGDIIKAIEDAGVSWEDYLALKAVPEIEHFNDLESEPAQVELVEEPAIEPVQEPAIEPQLDPFEQAYGETFTDLDEPDELELPFEEDLTPAQAPVAEEPKEEERIVVIKMVRENRLFQAYGYEFTREHPYAPVPESIADILIESFDGFREASSRELKEFYGA